MPQGVSVNFKLPGYLVILVETGKLLQIRDLGFEVHDLAEFLAGPGFEIRFSKASYVGVTCRHEGACGVDEPLGQSSVAILW